MVETSVRAASESGPEGSDGAVPREVLGESLALVEARYGLRLSGRQTRRFERALGALLADLGPDAAGLREVLAGRGSADLLEPLVADFTVGETHFFRVLPQVAALRDQVLPDLLARRADARQLRVWSAGCSTGEEPYTVALLLRELLPDLAAWDVAIAATDINRVALETARQGRYGAWSFRDTPDEVRARYFRQDGDRWQLEEPTRRLVEFGYLNLVDLGASFPGADGEPLDLVLCRNVTIYFGPETAQRLYRRLADCLAPDGYLVLGPSDPLPARTAPLEPVRLPNALVWRRESRVDTRQSTDGSRGSRL